MAISSYGLEMDVTTVSPKFQDPAALNWFPASRQQRCADFSTAPTRFSANLPACEPAESGGGFLRLD
jgi:hypothetical protein